MKSNQQLINNIIGQLHGINKMIDKGKDCQQVIVQLKAVKSAVSSLMNKIIESDANTCIDAIPKKDQKKIKKLFKEIIISN